MQTIGNHIRQLRQQKGFSLHKAADFLDMDPFLLRNIVRGKRNATKDQVIKLASYLGIEVKDLLTIYLEDRLSQAESKGESSKRVQNLSMELDQLACREIQTRVYKPSSPLDTTIQNIVYYSGNNKKYPYERALPDGSVQLVFNLDSDGAVPVSGNDFYVSLSPEKAWVLGIQEQYVTYQLAPYETTLSVQFTAGGFFELTKIPVTEIKNCLVDAEHIFGSSVLLLEKQMSSCNDTGQIIRMVEQYFLEKIKGQSNEHILVRYIIDNIDIPLSRLVERTGYSHKHVIHLFKKHVGITPKYFQRICRFNRSLKDILAINGEVNWPDIVFNNDYYDQPHFIREFNHFAGITPTSYLETGSTCSKLLHLRGQG